MQIDLSLTTYKLLGTKQFMHLLSKIPNYKYSSKQFSSEITMNKIPREYRGYSIKMPPMEGDLPLNY